VLAGISMVEGAMRAISTTDERIASILDMGEAGAPRDETTDVVVRLKDGRGFSLPVLTLRGVERRLAASPALAVTGVVVVRTLSDEALAQAVRTALERGIEHFGTLESPLEE
jgi:hypothetical protein